MAILEVEHLKKTYTTRLGSNRVEALKDVNFTVERGEFVAIMGESGSGKTTLLNLLAALDKPTGGQVRLNGKNLGELKEKEIAGFRRENLGFVFQDFNLLDTFSLRDNIYLPLVLEGKKYEEMSLRAEPIAKKLGITQILNKYPYEVSGGQKQRTAVARALITNPELVLADEPSGALDSHAADGLMKLFGEINEEGQTIVMVTHSVKAACSAKRVLFIKDGEVFHQLYRGSLGRDEMYQKISDTLLSCIGTVVMFFIMDTLAQGSGFDSMIGKDTILTVMGMGTYIIGLFAVIFLIYSNSFLVKRRKKEFGLFQILGMEKKHLAKILFFESLYLWAASLGSGILLGVLLYRLLFLVLMKLTGLNGTIGFVFSAKAVGSTMLLFGLTFVINFLLSLRQIHVSQPVELLHGGAQGEREPKTKLLTAVLGFMLLGVGYYLAQTSQSSMDALDKFFIAIALVMVGTYCLFSAGSIAFLKILKKNKNYYYQTRHFTSISGMLYRMKQNAVGLANICILSTGVLLVISISTCLWTGIEEVTYTRFPHQISIEANTGVSGIMKTVEPVSQKMIEEVKTGIDQHLEEKQLRKKYESDQRYYVMLAVVDRNKVEKTQSDDAAASTLIKIMEESEYNQVTGEQVELEPGQALVFQAKQKNYGYDTIELGNQTYEVKKWNTDKKSYILDEKTQVYETMTVVTRNKEAKEAYAAVQGKEPEGYSWEYALDLIGDAGEQITVGDEIETILTESSFNGWVEVREKERNTVYSLYGSLLFLGVFVGALFLMGAVMIIYYKQVSEGFDDRKRFQIMQKVGMSRKEIRQTIQSQVVTVFFLPLAVAVVHTMVAFPLTKRIMAMLNFPDSNLFLVATAITIAAFAVVYLIVYVLTARTYYKIVE